MSLEFLLEGCKGHVKSIEEDIEKEKEYRQIDLDNIKKHTEKIKKLYAEKVDYENTILELEELIAKKNGD